MIATAKAWGAAFMGWFGRKPKAEVVPIHRQPKHPGHIICAACGIEAASFKRYASGRTLCLPCAVGKR